MKIVKPEIKLKFIFHKKGETAKDCADKIYFNEEEKLYAVADGATRSFFPSIWAEYLVKNFCKKKKTKLLFTQKNLNKWLKPVQKRWEKKVKALIKKYDKYYLNNRFFNKESAVSTFLGLKFFISDKKLKWVAIAIGDTCLFHIKRDQSLEMYPIKKSDQFNSYPEYFASYEKDNNQFEPEFIEGYSNLGDVFVIATDALSCWVMNYYETNQIFPLDLLLKINENKIEEMRSLKDNRLVNDDVALLIIEITKIIKNE